MIEAFAIPIAATICGIVLVAVLIVMVTLFRLSALALTIATLSAVMAAGALYLCEQTWKQSCPAQWYDLTKGPDKYTNQWHWTQQERPVNPPARF